MKQTLIALIFSFSLLVPSGGTGYAQDFNKDEKWWRKTAEQGHARALPNFSILKKSQGGARDEIHPPMRNWLFKTAKQGDASAQAALGFMYHAGLGAVQDYKQAVKWLRKATEQGDANAPFKLGFMYEKGQGVIQDNVYAHMWFNIAASYGNTNAVKNQNIVAKRMTAADISKAQELARQCVKKEFKAC